MSLPKFNYRFLCIIAFIVIFDLIGSVSYYLHVARTFPTVPAGSFEAVVILMGDFNDDYSDIGQETRRRLNHAASLQSNNAIGSFLCLGGSRPQEQVIGAEFMKKYLQQQGIPPESIITSGTSFDTITNWADALEIITRHGWSTIGVVSSAMHLFRLKNTIAQGALQGKLTFLPFPYTESTPPSSMLSLWQAIHYEWVIYLLYSFPEPVYNLVIQNLRPQR